MTPAVQTRKTRQKDAIRAAFIAADRPLSPDEVRLLAQQEVDALSIATVYRNIATLVDEQWLTPVDVPGGATRYEVAGKEHHHHFQCNTCGTLHELAGCTMPARPALPRGFSYTRHEVFVYGTCAACTR